VRQNEHGQQTGAAEKRGGEAGGRVTLNEEQRTRIEKTVLSGRDVPRVDRIDFTVDVGAVVPRHVRFAHVPRTLVEINPEWRDDEYFVVSDEIVIVDRGRRVVGVVPLRSSSASFETRSRSTFAAGDVDIRRVQEVLLEKGYYHGPVDGVFGTATREALIRFQEREGIEARGSIDERTYVALGISGRIDGRSEGRVEGRTGSRIEGRAEGRAFQTEEKGRVDRKGASEFKRDQSAASGEAGGSSKSSGPRHANARDDNAKNNGGRGMDRTRQNNHPSALGQGEKPHALGENKASEQHGGTVGQSLRSQEPSAKSSKAGGASEYQRKHD
jgi:peptidoglycan hydrolase-like protein with peptidoglycan-binding domain